MLFSVITRSRSVTPLKKLPFSSKASTLSFISSLDTRTVSSAGVGVGWIRPLFADAADIHAINVHAENKMYRAPLKENLLILNRCIIADMLCISRHGDADK